MSERLARVRLMLSAESFLNGLRGVTDDVKRTGQAWGAALRGPTMEGLKASRDSLRAIAGEAQQAAKWGLTLGGALSLGGAAANVKVLEDKYRALAFELEQLTGKATKWQDVQAMIEPAADAASRTSEEMISVFEALRAKSGDVEYSAKAISVVGEAMVATGKSGTELGSIVGVLRKKWGISDMKDVRAALLQVFDATKGGKINFQELSEDLDELGSISRSAGMDGLEGFRKTLGLATMVAPQVNRSVSEVMTGLDQLTEKMRQQTVVQGLADSGGKAGKEFWENFLGQSDVEGRMRTLLERAGKSGKLSEFSKVALETEFTGREERAAYKSMTDPFFQAFGAASGSNADRTKAGLAAFDAHMRSMGATTDSWNRITERAVDNQQALSASMTAAKEALQRAFMDPKMVEALQRQAQLAPKVAHGLSKLVEYAVQNPLKAGAGYVVGRAALAGGSKMLVEMGQSAASAAGKTISEMFAAQVAKDGRWAAIGKVVGTAAAAVIAYEIGKTLIDKAMTGNRSSVEADLRDFNARNALVAKATEEARSGALSPETRSALEKEKARIEAEAKPRMGAGGTTTEWVQTPMGMMPKITREAPQAVAGDTSGGAVARLEDLKRLLSGDLKVRVVNQAPSGQSSNGLPPSTKNTPGAEGG